MSLSQGNIHEFVFKKQQVLEILVSLCQGSVELYGGNFLGSRYNLSQVPSTVVVLAQTDDSLNVCSPNKDMVGTR